MKWFISNKQLLELNNGLKNKSNSNNNISIANSYNPVKLISLSKINNFLNNSVKSNIELCKVLLISITAYHSIIPLLSKPLSYSMTIPIS